MQAEKHVNNHYATYNFDCYVTKLITMTSHRRPDQRGERAAELQRGAPQSVQRPPGTVGRGHFVLLPGLPGQVGRGCDPDVLCPGPSGGLRGQRKGAAG